MDSFGRIKQRARDRRVGHYMGRVVSHGCFGALSSLGGSSGSSSSSLVAGGVITRTPTLEVAVTNLLLQSATFTNASWVKTNATATADTTAAPNGVTEADTLTDADPANLGEVRQNVVIPNDAVQRVFSCYFTAGTSTQVKLRLLLSGGTAVDQSVDFNPISGIVTAQTGNPTIESLTIGGVNWFRVSIPATNNNSGNVTAQCIINPASANAGAQGTVIAWGAQLETGATPSSQIPTTAAQVTRTAGVIPNWILDLFRTAQTANTVLAGPTVAPSAPPTFRTLVAADLYTTGAWTPSLGGTATYNTQSGTYVKIGNLVWITGFIDVNVLGTGSNAVVTGLPFAATQPGAVTVTRFSGIGSNVVFLAGEIGSGGSTITMRSALAASNDISLTNAIFANGSRTWFSGVYLA